MSKAVYIHIPFCLSICGYCDFHKVIYKKEWASSYLDALFLEIKKSRIRKAKTLYIGGGTPSCLDENELNRLLSFVSPYLVKGGEFTFEANPESLTKEKINLLARYGVNRVSLGVQSSCPFLLKEMGRKHTNDDVKRAIRDLKEAGINNISVDLIYALPKETRKDLEKDISFLLSLDVPHISTYSLILEKGTRFFNDGVKESDEDKVADMFALIRSSLEKAGYHHYEISSFAREGKESTHNKEYWKDHEYYGFGSGASGYLSNVRYKNTPNLSLYLKGLNKKEEEIVSKKDDITYFLLTNLRLKEGFLISRFNKKFGKEFLIDKKEIIKSLMDTGLLEKSQKRISPTEKGMMLLDYILEKLM